MKRLERSVYRNTLALSGDFLFFAIGFAFFDPTVVVPAFINTYTGSEFLVGVFAALRTLMVTVPQIWAASILTAQPRKRPVLILSSSGGRLPLILLILATLLWIETHPMPVIIVLAVTFIAFYISEGVNGVVWPDLVAKVIPEGRRGRFFGFGQFISSIASAGAGFVVNWLLSNTGLDASQRWTWIWVGAAIAMGLSVVSMFFVKEDAVKPVEDKVDVMKSIRQMIVLIKTDKWLRRVVLVQLISSTASATFSFFILRAGEILPQVNEMLGTFLILQSIGTAVAAVVGGLIIDHIGSWASIRLAAIFQVCALVAATLAGITGIPLILYSVAFLCLGYVNSAFWWSFSSYLMDIADEHTRPIYLASSGILISITVFNSLIAGALFEKFQPEIIFAGAAILAVVGVVLATTLRKGVILRKTTQGTPIA